LSSKFNSHRVDWRGAIDYRWTTNLMTYLQVSTGYKGGGVNARPFFPDQRHAFQPETLTTYEAGFKSTLWDRVRFNADGFWNVYKGVQLPQTTCTWATVPGHANPCASQNNVGDAHVYGFEGEIEAHPVDAMEIDAAFSYLHFEYTKLAKDSLGAFITDTRPGMITPYTPNVKYSIGAQYKLDMPEGYGTVTPRVDWSYQSHVYTDPNNRPSNLIPGYGLMNLRLTWASSDEDWQAAFEMTNVTDKYYYLSIFDLTKSATGYTFGQPGAPREWAFTLKRKF
jgi:iron complex outermembrane receptor protein